MNLPDLESLRCFVAAAEQLNFRAAARQVGLTPAALGQRIRQLETLFDARLFDRTTRRVALTDAGLALVGQAQEALASASRCAEAIGGGLEAPPLSITIGSRHELGLSWITPMLRRLGSARSNLTIHLYVGSGSDLAIQVRHRRIDCAVISSAPSDPVLDSTLLHPEHYSLVASPKELKNHPLARPQDASHHTLLDIDASLPLFRYWRDSPSAPRLHFEDTRYLGTIAAIRQLVLLGDGVAVLPTYFVAPDLAKGRLTEPFARRELASDHFRLIYRRDDSKRSLFERLASLMRERPLR